MGTGGCPKRCFISLASFSHNSNFFALCKSHNPMRPLPYTLSTLLLVVVFVFVAAITLPVHGALAADGNNDDGEETSTKMLIPPDEQLQVCDPSLGTDAYVADSFLHIDAVHRTGAPHRGVWLFVVSEGRVLLVHRSARMVTCPDTWSLVGEHNQPGESYVDAARRGLMEELQVSWDESVTSWFLLESGPSLLDIHYLRRDGGVHRHDVQWTQSFVVELGKGMGINDTKVTLDDENRDFAFVPLDDIERWLESHDTCQLAEVERRVWGGPGPGDNDDVDDSLSSFERGTLGDLKVDSLRRVRRALLARRKRRSADDHREL